MSILEDYKKALVTKDRSLMENCLHDDYKFTNYSQGKIFTKSEVVNWAMSGDLEREKVRILYENDEIGVEHSIVKFKTKKNLITKNKFSMGSHTVKINNKNEIKSGPLILDWYFILSQKK